MVFSDLGQLVALGLLEPRIDWAYVGHHIAYNGIRVARTGIEGVVEVLPGQVRRLAGREVSSRSFWRPADFVAPPQQIHDPVAARQMLFEAIETSVERLADANTAIVVELSGGLDSSIVAMALRGRAATTAVNCTTSAPEGDERRYARQVAEAAGLPLRERALDPLEIDFRRRPAPGMARPGRTTVLQSVDAAFAREGEELSATAFFNGTGGDSVFCYMTSTAPAADRLLAQGLGPGFVATVLDIAALTGSTGWKVARLALRIAFLRRAPSPIRASLEHLTPNFRPNGPDPRPWLEGLGRAPPGRRRHVEAIAGLHGHVDGHDRNIVAPVIAPHAAQPVLEAVFRIPTWLWVAEGRDRAVARQAYVDLLPTDVFNRRSKGRINRFIVEAYNANRAVIDDLLAAGVLARQGVIDMAAVRRTLGAPVDLDDAAFMSVIRLVDVELWAQGWLDAGADAS
jgi:asparagine synthase (glutamine-hydrolysing)